LRQEQPGLSAEDRFIMIATEWKNQYKNTSQNELSSKSSSAPSNELSSKSSSAPSNESSASDDNINWKSPHTAYQKFLKSRIRQLRNDYPNLSNRDCMKMVASEWVKMKNGP
jgi:hypothetical protein